jgi:carbon storage regulator CsrA
MIAASPETLASILASPLEITVVAVIGDKVRLGIEANRAIAVHREEIFSKIEASRGEA